MNHSISRVFIYVLLFCLTHFIDFSRLEPTYLYFYSPSSPKTLMIERLKFRQSKIVRMGCSIPAFVMCIDHQAHI